MNHPRERWVAQALRAGGPEVIEVGVEKLSSLRTGEALVRVEAAGLNHAEALNRYGNYAVRLDFPYPLGGEGSGVVVAIGPGAPNVRIADAWYGEPRFIEAMSDRLVRELDARSAKDRAATRVLMTAHSLPKRVAVAEPAYLQQLSDTAEAIA